MTFTGVRFIRDRSLFIAGAGGGGFWGGSIFVGEQKKGSVVSENPKGGMAENFERIQTEDHSNLLGK